MRGFNETRKNIIYSCMYISNNTKKYKNIRIYTILIGRPNKLVLCCEVALPRDLDAGL